MSKSKIDKLAGAKSRLLMEEDDTPDDLPEGLDNYRDGGLYNVLIEKINPNPNQPRKYFDPEALEELTQSIKENGVLQPVIITTDERREIHLVAGERRYRAAKDAGLHKIPAIYKDGHSDEIALIENLQREDLKPVEEAEALSRLMDKHNYTQEQLSDIVGKGQSTISETLSLNKLPEQIKKEYRHADISRRILVEVAKQKTDDDKIRLFNQIKDNDLKDNDVRKITRKKSDMPQKTPAGVALDKTVGLSKSLAKVDMATVEEQERGQLITELRALKSVIEQVID